MKKIICKENRIDRLWDKYIFECQLCGFAPDTLRNKEQYFSLFYRFAELQGVRTTEGFSHEFFEDFVLSRIESDIKTVSINSCIRTINTFLKWLYQQGHTTEKYHITQIKTQEAIKQVYSTEALNILLEKPNNESFADFRTWVIINYILGTGNRISSVLSIANGDVDLVDGFINLPHTKNKKAQAVPLSTSLIFILKGYMDIRQGMLQDKLFCTEYGQDLTRSGADKALRRYCESRGVECLGYHAFRHPYVKHTTKIFSLRLKFFQAQPIPDAL